MLRIDAARRDIGEPAGIRLLDQRDREDVGEAGGLEGGEVGGQGRRLQEVRIVQGKIVVADELERQIRLPAAPAIEGGNPGEEQGCSIL